MKHHGADGENIEERDGGRDLGFLFLFLFCFEKLKLINKLKYDMSISFS